MAAVSFVELSHEGTESRNRNARSVSSFEMWCSGGLVVVVVGEVVASNVALICSDHNPQPSPVLKPDETVCRLRYHALCSLASSASDRSITMAPTALDTLSPLPDSQIMQSGAQYLVFVLSL